MLSKKELISIYEDAAMKVASGEETFSCIALCGEGFADQYPDRFAARLLYGETVKLPTNAAALIDSQPNSKTTRVLLLLLMAEWVKTDYVKES